MQRKHPQETRQADRFEGARRPPRRQTAKQSGSDAPDRPDAVEMPADDLDPISTGKAILKLRRISGLGWDELGELFGVSLDDIHSWASGKPLDADEKTRVMRTWDVVRYVDRGGSKATRKALLETGAGKSPFDLLTEQRFDEACAVLGPGTPIKWPKRIGLDQESKDARRPLPPRALVNAKHDRVHKDPGRTRVARTVRNKRRGDA